MFNARHFILISSPTEIKKKKKMKTIIYSSTISNTELNSCNKIKVTENQEIDLGV